jgi:heat shock protein HslJ
VKPKQRPIYIIILLGLIGLLWPLIVMAQADVVCEADVIVQADDWLSKIAEKVYGDVTLYPAIAGATNLKAVVDDSYSAIDNPDLIEPGWKLCVPSLAEAQASPAGSALASTGLTVDALANATYSGIYEEPIQLTAGVYEGEPFVAGSSTRPRVTLIDDLIARGDLNGDGVGDAAVLLVENSGSSGVFTYLAVVVDQAGQPVNAETTLIGDRVQIKSMVIQSGQVILELVTQGPDDPFCCATLKLRATFELQGDQLVEAGVDELGTVSLQDLNGTSWVLADFDFDRQPVLPTPFITAEFSDGQIDGSAGCNSYSATITGDGPQALTIGPATATKKACPDPILNQETQYRAALSNVSQWSYLAGRLAFTYQDDSGSIETLMFEPASADQAATGAAEITATEVIVYTPANIPVETRPGSCFTNALGLGREDAYRCTTDANEIFDPCFLANEAPTVVCGANPTTGETGFVLALTEPLPEPDLGNLTQPWLVELADGAICGLATGTAPVIEDKRANYFCDDNWSLLGDLQAGEVWLAEKVLIDRAEDGFVVTESTMVPIRTVWR